ncbi:uncharacterized protein [Nicotiana tomentosiformis]|uniref:uncharacterized protein n=1 Tax=Nicotiana tomentosiformis TaxID=4098 RepID=UPI00388C894B
MRFFELDHHAVWLVPTDRQRIRMFIDGLTYQLRLLMTRERVSCATFDEVVNIARQIEMVRSQEHGEREVKRLHSSGGFSDVPSGGPLISEFPSSSEFVPCSFSSGSSTLSASNRFSGSWGPPQYLPPYSERGCFECGDLDHIKRYCPCLSGGPAQRRSQTTTSAPVTSPPAQPAWGGAQSARDRPRGGGRSGGSQARFYVIPARPDAIASDVVITGLPKTIELRPSEGIRIRPSTPPLRGSLGLQQEKRRKGRLRAPRDQRRRSQRKGWPISQRKV